MTKARPSTQMVVFGMGGIGCSSPVDMSEREEILKEFYCSQIVVLPSGTKMYQNLCRQYGVYQVSMRCSTSPCSERILQIQPM